MGATGQPVDFTGEAMQSILDFRCSCRASAQDHSGWGLERSKQIFEWAPRTPAPLQEYQLSGVPGVKPEERKRGLTLGRKLVGYSPCSSKGLPLP